MLKSSIPLPLFFKRCLMIFNGVITDMVLLNGSRSLLVCMVSAVPLLLKADSSVEDGVQNISRIVNCLEVFPAILT